MSNGYLAQIHEVIIFKEDLLMNKAELVAAVAEKTGFTKKDAELAVNAFVSSVENSLENREKSSRSLLQKLLYSRLARL